jgi:transcriptional regulator with XRE-family HTH domain
MNTIQLLFSINLKRIRAIRGISQDQLASILDTDQRTISLYENAHQFPDTDRIDKIAKALDISIHELFIDRNTQIDYIQFYNDINAIVSQYKKPVIK